LQPQKAFGEIEVTLGSMEIEVRPLQPEKAPFPMFSTELGMVTEEERPVQPENILSIENQLLIR
jgi:hypothetical protein